jgi:hypothetical protein
MNDTEALQDVALEREPYEAPKLQEHGEYVVTTGASLIVDPPPP